MKNSVNTKKWYGTKQTLVALITGFLSSILSLANIFISMSK